MFEEDYVVNAGSDYVTYIVLGFILFLIAGWSGAFEKLEPKREGEIELHEDI